MGSDLRIRRDRSALADGTLFGRRRKGISRWKLALWLLVVGTALLILWQRTKVQPLVMAMIGEAPTATPDNLTYAQRGYTAFLQGNLELAIDDYCLASHGLNYPTFSSPRCDPPKEDSAEARQIDVNIAYELIRVLIYRSYDDRRLGIYDQDGETWGRVITTVFPKNERAHAIYSFALTNNNHAEQAVPEGLTALSLNKQDGEAHAYLSAAYYSSARYSDAVSEGEQAISLAPQSVDAHIAAAQALFISSQFDAAQNEYQAAITINPRLGLSYFYLAAFFVFRNQQEAAIAEYDQVLTLDNKSVKAYTRKCAAYFNIGVTDKALANCQNATTLDKSYTDAWKWQGQVLYNRRDYEDALLSFSNCRDLENQAVKKSELKTGDRLPECWYLAGLTYYLLGKCDRAYPLFNEVLSFTDNSLAIRLTRKGIDGCGATNPNIPTPTMLPTIAPVPAPILN